jgi:hypothetical protein
MFVSDFNHWEVFDLVFKLAAILVHSVFELVKHILLQLICIQGEICLDKSM